MTRPPDPEPGELFEFPEFPEGGFIEPNLGNAERSQMRALAQPGGPIWQIVKSMLDYASVLKDNIPTLLLGTEADKQKAFALAVEVAAVESHHAMWQRLLAVLPEEERTDS